MPVQSLDFYQFSRDVFILGLVRLLDYWTLTQTYNFSLILSKDSSYLSTIVLSFYQILEGSNNCGRIDHKLVAGQQGADVDRVNAIAKVCPLKYVELEPGNISF